MSESKRSGYEWSDERDAIGADALWDLVTGVPEVVATIVLEEGAYKWWARGWMEDPSKAGEESSLQEAQEAALEAATRLEEGRQILYVPGHAGGDEKHPDVERGFVTSIRGETVFCRYWSNHHSGLRTLANSEGTPRHSIVIKDTVGRERVERIIYNMKQDKARSGWPEESKGAHDSFYS